MDRRNFLKNSFFSSMALGVPFLTNDSMEEQLYFKDKFKGDGPKIIDTNINLFDWPFKTFKYSTTQEIVDKLNSCKISQAWAGTFEALFHENIDKANARLKKECNKYEESKLLPIGSVNTRWPDWEEDLRRCNENYQMKGIRIYPSFQRVKLDGSAFKKLVTKATKRDMFIQLVGELTDPRHGHPLVPVWDFNFEPILEVAKNIPDAKIQLLHWSSKVNSDLLEKLVNETNVVFDISFVEGVGELGKLLNGEDGRVKIPRNRLLFGSHMPYFILEAALLRLFESPLSKKQFRSVAFQNAKQFLTV